MATAMAFADSVLEKGALAEYCTYLSYDRVRELAAERNLAHMHESILEEYEEEAAEE